MKNVFIDSNIWLSLYYFSKDDLAQFSKLNDLVGKDIHLLIPSQTVDEVIRNRDAKIKEALSKFEKFSVEFPAFTKNYDEYNEFYNSYNELKSSHKVWLEKIKEDIKSKNLSADNVINDFFINVDLLDCNDEIVRKAELRYKRGNPPGKDNKYGDAINWECLLEYAPDNKDLYFISSDKDYSSVIGESQFNLFLQEEWKEKKNSDVIFFNSLVSFLNKHFESIKLKREQEKDKLIIQLSESGSFYRTHKIIEKLNEFSDFTRNQQDDILESAVDNSQIYQIIGDNDIREFYSGIIADYEGENETVKKVKDLLEETDGEDDDFDIPDWLL